MTIYYGVGYFATLNNSYFALALAFFSGTATVSTVLLTRNGMTVFNPFLYVSLSIFLGYGGRLLFIRYFPENNRATYLLWGENFNLIADESITICAGIVALCIGFLALGTKRLPFNYNANLHYQVSQKKLLWVALGVIAICSVAALNYVSSAGVDLYSIAGISKKRAVEVTGSDGTLHYTALGHLRVWFVLSELTAYLCLIVFFKQKRKIFLWLSIGLLLTSAIVPFLSSSRSSIIFLALNTGLLCLAFGVRIPKILWVAVASFSIAILLGMGALREYKDSDTLDADLIEFVRGPLEATVGSGNFFPGVRSAIIIDRVPEAFQYELGSTYLYWVVQPIPRIIWPEKPNTALGIRVRQDILRGYVRNSGSPPGMIGEGYMNFGSLGAILGPLLIGLLLRLYFNTFLPTIGTSTFYSLMYVATLLKVGLYFIALNFSFLIAQILIIAFWVITLKKFTLAKPRKS
jgi:oligosaccharide repeat unit polymerase